MEKSIRVHILKFMAAINAFHPRAIFNSDLITVKAIDVGSAKLELDLKDELRRRVGDLQKCRHPNLASFQFRSQLLPIHTTLFRCSLVPRAEAGSDGAAS